MNKKHIESCSGIENCIKIFVSWTWLVGILFCILTGVGGVIYSYAKIQGKAEVEMVGIKEDIADLKSMREELKSISIDIAIIKKKIMESD